MSQIQHNEAFQILLHNILWLRAHYGYSKTRMAKILKVGIGTIDQIEKGILPPRLSAEIIFHLQSHFGIRPADLVGRLLP